MEFRTGEHPAPPDHLPFSERDQRCNAIARGFFCTLPKHLRAKYRGIGWTAHEAGVISSAAPETNSIVAWWTDPNPDEFQPL